MLETIETISTRNVVLRDLCSYFILMACECACCATQPERIYFGDTIGVIGVQNL